MGCQGGMGECPGACGLFFPAAEGFGDPQTPLFLGLDKSGDRELFLVKFSTATLKTSQAWSFAD